VTLVTLRTAGRLSANRLAFAGKSAIAGSVAGSTASGASNTLELSGGTAALSGVASGAGTVMENAETWTLKNFGTVAVDAGASGTTSGRNTISSLLNNGSIDLTGSLIVSGAPDASSAGLFKLEGTSTLEVAVAPGTQPQMDFVGSSRLSIDNFGSFGIDVRSSSYAGPGMLDFGVSDTIDVRLFSSTGASLTYDPSTGLPQLVNRASQRASLSEHSDPGRRLKAGFDEIQSRLS
jgi:hypothetical protein